MALAKIGGAANFDFLDLALVVFEHGLAVAADDRAGRGIHNRIPAGTRTRSWFHSCFRVRPSQFWITPFDTRGIGFKALIL